MLRSKELHEYHLQQLEENEGLRNHFSKEYGVNKKSILSMLRTLMSQNNYHRM